MMTVAELQKAILSLPDDEYAQLVRWLRDRDWERWELEFDEDVKAGRLDFLKAEVEQAQREGTLRELK